MHRQLTRWVFLLSFLMGNALLFGGTATKVFKESLVLEPNQTVVVKNRNGNIEVRAVDTDSVRITADIEVKTGSTREAKNVLEKVNITIEHEAGDVIIGADYPENSGDWSFWDWIFGRRTQVQIRYWIDMPVDAALKAHTINGKVSVEGVRGKLSVHTTNGRVQVQGGANDVDARTTNGSVEVEMDSIPKDSNVSLHTTNGSVRVILPADAEADVNASTVNGSISTDFPMEVHGKFIGKHVQGAINGGGGRIDLKTVNGSMHVERALKREH